MAKIAIILPDEVYRAVEEARLAKGARRSAFFRRAVEEHLRRAREREDVERYIRGYQLYPETQEEVALAEATLGYIMAENPWEEDADK